MNIFKKVFCRTYQIVFRLMIPILPYREPQLLKDNSKVSGVFKRKNVQTVMLVTDSTISSLGLANSLIEAVENDGVKVVVFDKTVANPTTANVEEALALYQENQCGGLIAFGGGSSMDCAKAVGARVARPKKTCGQMKGVLKVHKKIPTLVAIPTTAGTGSETTLAAVIVDSQTRHKYAINDFPLIPRYALLDPSLTVGLPKFVTATTGMDALTHAVEAYIGRSTTRETRKNAKEATKLIFENILTVYEHGDDLVARGNMLHASYLAGLAFTKSYVGYIHAIAHSLGGKYDVPHGQANAILMPYVLKKYGRKIFKKLWELGLYANLFDEDTPIEVGAKIFIEKIESLNEKMGIGRKIPEILEEDIQELAITAEKEGNPLYPVPVLWGTEQFEEVYRSVRK